MITNKHKRIYWRSLCLFVAVSFLAALVPIASASIDKSNTMPCCAGKAGHCDSGLTPKPAPRISEPMCGRDNPKSTDDANTIVAEPSQAAETTSHAAGSISLHKPCPMDCGACMASSQQQRRERGILQPIAFHIPSVNIDSNYENQPISFFSNGNWDQISPRGPPARS